MTYQETLDFLYNHLPYFKKLGGKALKKGSKNITALCHHLGNPQTKFKSIHIAGTNGKGSTSHYLAAILQESGYKTGLYTSPHLKDYRERFRINGAECPEDFVIKFVEQNKEFILSLEPSFFELSVALAFQFFAESEVDVAVIEVGLGGKWDATNIITPLLSVITNIGYDHKDILGDTLAKIASEKAGIIKPTIPVVVSEWVEETKPVFEEVALRNNAIIYWTDHLTIQSAKLIDNSLVVSLKDNDTNEEINISSELTGSYQANNLRGVWVAAQVLKNQFPNISNQSILSGIAKVKTLTNLKGRWQIIQDNPLIVCDTGHNKEAFEALCIQLASLQKKHYHYLLAFSSDKDSATVLHKLPRPCTFYFTSFDSFRSKQLTDYQGLADNFIYFDDVNIGIESISNQLKEDEMLFIGGSTYLVAEINSL